MNNPDIKKQLQEQGMVTVPMSPTELQKFVAEDTLKWAKVTEQGKKK
jgi:tripartite-type tricarboxylate transporter receptor subunit TctC